MKDLEDIRREYLSGGLRRKDLVADPMDQFKQWLSFAIEHKASTDPTAMVLATADATGRPSQRIVLLKHADEKGFVFYTNLGSKKAHDIAENDQVCLHFGWLAFDRQVIIYGKAGKLPVAQAAQYFMSRPKESQIAAWTSHQSQKVSSRALLQQAFEQMKTRFAAGEVPLPSFWGGYLVEPTAIEFWQGGGSRMHDRFMYRKASDGTWTIERLQP
jgi:pyridoxamine 5'-phosphate oxidase